MRLLLLGKNGQVGWEAQRTLCCFGDVIALGRDQLDLERTELVAELLDVYQPDVVINTAAYTAVDRAETERQRAHLVNAAAPAEIARQTKKRRVAFIHFSTDYVFDGNKSSAYVETDTPLPLNVYGMTKLEGERAIQDMDGAYLILRTGWVYSLRRDTFVNKVLTWASQNKVVRVVDDQVGSPTWSRLLAEICAQLIAMGMGDIYRWVNERKGVYHLAGDGAVSRFEWAQAVLELAGLTSGDRQVELLPVSSAEFPAPARRPPMSALDCTQFFSTFGLKLPHWRLALQMAMEDIPKHG
ncbi:MAG: dTDP-4-dehydrorhamnose reductase [Anaerolineae bacterium]|nr:dTDP-4-dehydrorhamnose reductase [Anaerolineae bacterium]